MVIATAKALLLNATVSPNTARAYGSAVDDFEAYLKTSNLPFNKQSIQAYRKHLIGLGASSATINLRMCALRRLAIEAADAGMLAEDELTKIQRVQGIKTQGVRIGNWLTPAESQTLIATPDVTTTKGLRDRAILAVMIGCGLRRNEVAALEVVHIQTREGRDIIVDIVGKHGRVRSVPMPMWTRTMVDAWLKAAAITTGKVFRAMHKSGKVVRAGMSAQMMYDMVKEYASACNTPKFAPHDGRRTFAKLAHTGGSSAEQIQYSLGHESVVTTQKYLGIWQDIKNAPADHLGLKFATI
jgi:site-specific recombinase XerD